MKNDFVSCRIDKKVKDIFQKKYPFCLSRFVVNCIKFAIKDKKFFDAIFFASDNNMECNDE